MHVQRHKLSTPDGWTLELHRGVRPGTAPGKPVVFVPGFGMNSFIFRFHPRGTSFMEALLDAGFDPWSVDPRGLSTTSAHPGRSTSISLTDHAFIDLPATFDFIAKSTGHERIHAIGCSLGGALLYGYGGAIQDHRIDRLVTMGTPFRWIAISPIVSAFARLAPLLGQIPMRGSRRMARVGLPLAVLLAPGALSIYLNPALTHTGPVRELVRTVEDPHPRINRQVARWIQAKDLKLGGINVTEALRSFERPLLVVAGNADQICPAESALSALQVAAGLTRALLVGSDQQRVAHADLFIGDFAPAQVFAPVVAWLGGDPSA